MRSSKGWRPAAPAWRPSERKGDEQMAYAAGVDVGSTQTKAVIISEQGRLVGRSLIDTGASVVRAAEHAYQQALAGAGLEEREVSYIVGTGYGRYRVTFGDTQVTEIS